MDQEDNTYLEGTEDFQIWFTSEQGSWKKTIIRNKKHNQSKKTKNILDFCIMMDRKRAKIWIEGTT
jgi:hypothetical protein